MSLVSSIKGKINTAVAALKKNDNDPEKMHSKEYVSYGVASFGYGSIGIMSAGYLFLFWTAIGIPTATVAIIITATKLFDAINDPIIATVIEMHKGKKGRFTPFLFKFAPVLAIASILLFLPIEGLDSSMKVIFALASYALYETFSTFSGTAFNSVKTVMSRDPVEQSLFLTTGRIGNTLAGAIPGLIPLLFAVITAIIGQTQFYFICAVIFGIMGLVGCLFTRNIKERIVVPQQKKQIWDGFVTFFRNRRLIIIWLTNISAVVSGISWAVSALYWMHSLGNFALQTVFWSFTSIPPLIVSLFSPLIIKRFKPKNIVIACKLIESASYVMMFIGAQAFGYASIVGIIFVFGFTLMAGMLGGVSAVAMEICIINTFDYVYHKTGKRAEATSYMAMGMLNKLVYAIGASIGAFMLAKIGFKEGEGVVQTQAVKDGIWLLFAIPIPIGAFLSVIPMFFFKPFKMPEAPKDGGEEPPTGPAEFIYKDLYYEESFGKELFL